MILRNIRDQQVDNWLSKQVDILISKIRVLYILQLAAMYYYTVLNKHTLTALAGPQWDSEDYELTG